MTTPEAEFGSGCEDCQRCEACSDIAFCLSQPGTRPCPHDRALCGDCLEECPACCDAMLTASLQAAFDRFDGDPYRHPGTDTRDPLTELAAESRAVTDRFWNGVGDRSHLKDRHE